MCPKCQQPSLKQKYVSEMNLTVDCCPRCKGIWFDGGELSQAVPEADRRVQIPPNAVRLQALCPTCGRPLYAFPFPGTRVVIEMCRKCEGLWLDAGEFAAIRQARRRLEEPRAPAEPAELPGVKGALIRFIDSAIDRLTTDGAD
jgi:Zn-finger nucleic acid-binding protein